MLDSTPRKCNWKTVFRIDRQTPSLYRFGIGPRWMYCIVHLATDAVVADLPTRCAAERFAREFAAVIPESARHESDAQTVVKCIAPLRSWAASLRRQLVEDAGAQS